MLRTGGCNMKINLLKAAALGLGMTIAAAQGASAAVQTWSMSAGTATNALGNTLPFLSSPDSWLMDATAYTTTGVSANFIKAAANGFSGRGLGVCESSSGCSSPNHAIDNNGLYDFILLSFDRPVTNISVTISGVSGYDTDVSYFLGTLAGGLPFDLTGYTPTSLGSLFSRVDLSRGTLGDAVTSSFNIAGTGNFLLIGTSINSITYGRDDVFKLKSVSGNTAVPEPAAWGLMILGFAGLAFGRRRLVRA